VHTIEIISNFGLGGALEIDVERMYLDCQPGELFWERWYPLEPL
jgi:hypothetical protein